MRTKRIAFLLLVAITLFVFVPSSAISQDESAGTARVRIGYFGIDPRTVDTYIDGEIASFSDGWMLIEWEVEMFPGMRTQTATPFMNFDAGVRNFALVPKGDNLDVAILGPEEVLLEADHVYSIAVMGDEENIAMVVNDETVAFADADPTIHFMSTSVHNLNGAPPLATAYAYQTLIENQAYGEVKTAMTSSRSPLYSVTIAAEGQNTVVFQFNAITAAGISDFAAMNGEYLGTRGVDYYLCFNWGYPGEISVVEGEPIVVGGEVSGEIADVAQRVHYVLTLESPAVLNIYAKATGDRHVASWGEGPFDPVLYIYDADGNLLLWNIELTFDDDNIGTPDAFDAGFEAISLEAARYIIAVGGSSDIVTGPYTLLVEDAASD